MVAKRAVGALDQGVRSGGSGAGPSERGCSAGHRQGDAGVTRAETGYLSQPEGRSFRFGEPAEELGEQFGARAGCHTPGELVRIDAAVGGIDERRRSGGTEQPRQERDITRGIAIGQFGQRRAKRRRDHPRRFLRASAHHCRESSGDSGLTVMQLGQRFEIARDGPIRECFLRNLGVDNGCPLDLSHALDFSHPAICHRLIADGASPRCSPSILSCTTLNVVLAI